VNILAEVKPVDPALLQKAVESFAEGLSKASPEDNRDAICVCACIKIETGAGLLVDHQEMFRDVSSRLYALDEVICAQQERISAEKRFPSEWVEIAATAPLVHMRFDANLFTWPEAEVAAV